MKPQTLELKARRRGADRHAGPAARPHRGQELRAEPGRVRGARRGRPHARHRLPARPAAHPVATCPSSARRCCSRPPSRPRSGAWPRATCRTRCWSRWRGPNATATNVEQHFYSVADRRQAPRRAASCCKERAITQALVFVNSKLGCARLARSFERDGLQHQRAARRQVAGRAAEGARRVQARRGRRAGGHRRGRARPGHRRPAGGVQLRRAVQRRGLRAPHRPHRPRRRLGPGGDAGVARRHAPGGRHREADQEEDRDRAVRARRRAPRRARRATARAHDERRRAPRRAPRRAAQRRATRAPRGAARPVLRPALRGQRRRGRAGLGAARRRAAPRGLSPNIKPKKKVAALFGGRSSRDEQCRRPDRPCRRCAAQPRQQGEHRRHVGRQRGRPARASAATRVACA